MLFLRRALGQCLKRSEHADVTSAIRQIANENSKVGSTIAGFDMSGLRSCLSSLATIDSTSSSSCRSVQQKRQQESRFSTVESPSPPVKEAGMPWTPTRLLVKRKTYPKRMAHLMSVLEKEKEEQAKASKGYPSFGPGDNIQLTLSIPQNKGRETVFKGICIAKRNRGWRTSFTLRNVIGNNGGIERSFPLYSPHIKDLKVLEGKKKKKYRRAKLYYLRNLQPKEYRIA
jgi:large subunit ribosomal protein L19